MKRILFLLVYRIEFSLFINLIKSLKSLNRYEIYFYCNDTKIRDDLLNVFSIDNIFTKADGFIDTLYDKINPHIIICQDVWRADFVNNILLKAKNKNIPILMYDHGTLYVEATKMQEYENHAQYRGNVVNCSHIACWGNIGKKCWTSFGVLKKKFYVTGAIQHDELNNIEKNNLLKVKEEVCNTLRIDKNKKIIILCTCFQSKFESIKQNCFRIVKMCENFVEKNTSYQLVVKQHPSEAIIHSIPIYKFRKNTILIANPYEDKYENTKVIEFSKVVYVSEVVISNVSSVLIPPLYFGIPIVFLDAKNSISENFKKLGRRIFFVFKNKDNFNELITKKLKMPMSRIEKSRKLAKNFNYGCKGNATIRLIALIDKILKEQDNKIIFYKSEIEEIKECIRKYPSSPYPYRNAINYYYAKNDFINAEKYFSIFIKKSHDPNKVFTVINFLFKRYKYSKEEMYRFYKKYYSKLNNSDSILLEWAIELRKNNKLTLSIKILNMLFNKNISESMINIIYEKALCFSAMKKYKNALSFYFRILKKYSPDESLKPRLYFRIGEAYYELKEFNKSLKYLLLCLSLNPQHKKSHELVTKLKSII